MAWVLVDPERWFGSDFVTRAPASSEEKEIAIAATVENGTQNQTAVIVWD